jgi:hypothetical protein
MTEYRHTTVADLKRNDFPPEDGDDGAYYTRRIRRCAARALRLAAKGMPPVQAITACATVDEDGGEISLLDAYADMISGNLRANLNGCTSFPLADVCFPPSRRRVHNKVRYITRWPWQSVPHDPALRGALVAQLAVHLAEPLRAAGYDVTLLERATVLFLFTVPVRGQ